MIVDKERNADVFSLFQVDVLGSKIRVSMKNGATLDLVPVIIEGDVADYKAEYLTAKENREIKKLKNKIAEMHGKIDSIRQGDFENEDCSEDNPEDCSDIEDESEEAEEIESDEDENPEE